MADKYVFDTNSFVEAYRKFYAFDIAPGYWRRFEREMQGETPRFEIGGEGSDHEYYTTE